MENTRLWSPISRQDAFYLLSTEQPSERAAEYLVRTIPRVIWLTSLEPEWKTCFGGQLAGFVALVLAGQGSSALCSTSPTAMMELLDTWLQHCTTGVTHVPT